MSMMSRLAPSLVLDLATSWVFSKVDSPGEMRDFDIKMLVKYNLDAWVARNRKAGHSGVAESPEVPYLRLWAFFASKS